MMAGDADPSEQTTDSSSSQNSGREDTKSPKKYSVDPVKVNVISDETTKSANGSDRRDSERVERSSSFPNAVKRRPSKQSMKHQSMKQPGRATQIAKKARLKSENMNVFLRKLRAADQRSKTEPTESKRSKGDSDTKANAVDSTSVAARTDTRETRRARERKSCTSTKSSAVVSDDGSHTPLSLTLNNCANHIRTKSFSTLETIDDEHSEFELTFCMLHGLFTSFESLEKKREKLLANKHFKQNKKLRVVTKGQEFRFGKWPSKLGAFVFKDYAPRVFQEIRRNSGVDHHQYVESVCHNNYIEFVSNSKSGAFFFFSNDGRFMIKTIEQAEAKTLLRILQKYYLHLKQYPDSLIARFYGLHRVQLARPMHGRSKYYFVVMQSVFKTTKYIHAIFDLKGSQVGREATEKEKKRIPSNKMTGTILKDNDLLQSKIKINLGIGRAGALLEQLQKDSELLAELVQSCLSSIL